MFNKKRTLMILLAILLLAVVVLSACDSGFVKPGQEFAADDIVDKLIEEVKKQTPLGCSPVEAKRAPPPLSLRPTVPGLSAPQAHPSRLYLLSSCKFR